MSRLRRLALLAAVAASGPAAADAMPPFYGYSGYFGQPTTYYTRDPDVHQSTTMRDGAQGFGVRTYSTGGPFWGFKTHRKTLRSGRDPVRVKG